MYVRTYFYIPRSMMADEKWYFAKREGGKVLLVDGVECNVMPKGSKCNDADKTMFLALGCRPRMIEGEMYDGKIALMPCTEDYVTRRKSRFGPKGALIQINKNADAAFYTELGPRDYRRLLLYWQRQR